MHQKDASGAVLLDCEEGRRDDQERKGEQVRTTHAPIKQSRAVKRKGDKKIPA